MNKKDNLVPKSAVSSFSLWGLSLHVGTHIPVLIPGSVPLLAACVVLVKLLWQMGVVSRARAEAAKPLDI